MALRRTSKKNSPNSTLVTTSPASKTIAVYEMNPELDWVGPPDEAINLTVKPTLLANDEPEKRKNHWLKPAPPLAFVGCQVKDLASDPRSECERERHRLAGAVDACLRIPPQGMARRVLTE